MLKNLIRNKKIIGWAEWLQLPQLGLPVIKAKVDTGARTSALHAFNITPYQKRNGEDWVKFQIHPLQGNADLTITCRARVVDERLVTDSGGKSERRYVIETLAYIANTEQYIEITLTNREKMAYRMLLGRQAISKFGLLVNPGQSTLLQKIKPSVAREIYTRFSRLDTPVTRLGKRLNLRKKILKESK